MTRRSTDSYFMQIARITAEQSTCLPVPGRRPDEPAGGRQVGCVLVLNRRIIATGYNGSLAGTPHCDDVGHLHDGRGKCVRTVHAEANAVADASDRGVGVHGAVAYVTYQPCIDCAKLLVSAGVVRIVCGEPYLAEREEAKIIPQLLEGTGVVVEVYEGD